MKRLFDHASRILCVVLTVTLVACQSENTPSTYLVTKRDGVILDAGLYRVIEDYYKAEKEKDWIRTYAFRTNAFQKLIPVEKYRTGMEKGSLGWTLEEVKIVGVKSASTQRIHVNIKFTERFDENVASVNYSGRVSGGINRFSENTVWDKVEGKWVCIEAGTRTHMPLNGRMAYE